MEGRDLRPGEQLAKRPRGAGHKQVSCAGPDRSGALRSADQRSRLVRSSALALLCESLCMASDSWGGMGMFSGMCSLRIGSSLLQLLLRPCRAPPRGRPWRPAHRPLGRPLPKILHFLQQLVLWHWRCTLCIRSCAHRISVYSCFSPPKPPSHSGWLRLSMLFWVFWSLFCCACGCQYRHTYWTTCAWLCRRRAQTHSSAQPCSA